MLGLKLNHVSKRGPMCVILGIWYIENVYANGWEFTGDVLIIADRKNNYKNLYNCPKL